MFIGLLIPSLAHGLVRKVETEVGLGETIVSYENVTTEEKVEVFSIPYLDKRIGILEAKLTKLKALKTEAEALK